MRFERRSDFNPTRTSGVLGQKWRTSGYHYGLSAVFLHAAGAAYLIHDILQGVGTIDGEANEEEVCLRI